jgi:multicomponent Na+:H+ antiporter subunit D
VKDWAAILIICPLLIPLLSGATGILLIRRRRMQRVVGEVGAVLYLLAAIATVAAVQTYGPIVTHLGDWPAPYGIVLVADELSSLMILLTGVVGLVVLWFARYAMGVIRVALGFYPLAQMLILGVSGAFLTGDLFNLFVWFEVMLIASFVLLVLGGERPQLEGAVKYVTLNLISSVLFLSALGILYGKAGTLNMADLAVKLQNFDAPDLLTAVACMFMVSFGIKAGVFPVFMWLPASYHTPPVAITALFSALLTKVGVYALIRMFTLVFTHETAYMQTVFTIIAITTMITGVLGAVAQYDMRRLLAFHIVSQIGYLIMGLAIGTTAALAATIYFFFHVVLAKTLLFFVAGVIHRLQHTYDLKILGGLYPRYTFLSLLFLVGALSLGGIPPFAGFIAKLGLIVAALDVHAYGLTGVALAVSLLTLFSMTKIWNEAFSKPLAGTRAVPRDTPAARRMQVPVAATALLIVLLSISAPPFYDLCEQAASALTDPQQYINAVLGGQP